MKGKHNRAGLRSENISKSVQMISMLSGSGSGAKASLLAHSARNVIVGKTIGGNRYNYLGFC